MPTTCARATANGTRTTTNATAIASTAIDAIQAAAAARVARMLVPGKEAAIVSESRAPVGPAGASEAAASGSAAGRPDYGSRVARASVPAAHTTPPGLVYIARSTTI